MAVVVVMMTVMMAVVVVVVVIAVMTLRVLMKIMRCTMPRLHGGRGDEMEPRPGDGTTAGVGATRSARAGGSPPARATR